MDNLFIAKVLEFFAVRCAENPAIHGVSVYAVVASPAYTVELRHHHSDGVRSIAAQTISSSMFLAAHVVAQTDILANIEDLLMERIKMLASSEEEELSS